MISMISGPNYRETSRGFSLFVLPQYDSGQSTITPSPLTSFFPFLFRVFGVFFPLSVFPFVDAAPLDAPRSQRVHALIDHSGLRLIMSLMDASIHVHPQMLVSDKPNPF